MESNNPSTTTYKQITVDVPEERVAEFHAFFARFLAGPRGRGRGRGPGGPIGKHHGRHCGGAHRRGYARPDEEQATQQTPDQPSETTEV